MNKETVWETITWVAGDQSGTMHNRTFSEAYSIIIDFGHKPKKWWQWWKHPATMFGYGGDDVDILYKTFL